MCETWYKSHCSKCNTINWISNGDTSDLSGVDVEGYKCWKCGNIEYFGDEEHYEFEKDINGWESKEDIQWELGLEAPK